MSSRKSVAPQRKPLSRTQIAEMGLRLLDKDGLEGLSMRKLALALGVEAMSLYNHVRDKSELLQDIANLVVSKIELPDPKLAWRKRVELLLSSCYETLTKHPPVVLLLARDEVQIGAPRALAVLEAAASALAASGLSPARQVSAFRGLIAVVFGFALTHTRGANSTRAEADAVWTQWDPQQWQGAGLPYLNALGPQFLRTHAEDDLAFNIRIFLDSLERDALSGGG